MHESHPGHYRCRVERFGHVTLLWLLFSAAMGCKGKTCTQQATTSDLRLAVSLYAIEGGTWEDVRSADMHVQYGPFEVGIRELGVSLTFDGFERWIENGGARRRTIHVTLGKGLATQRDSLESSLGEKLKRSGCLRVVFQQGRSFFDLENPSVIRVYDLVGI